jgi:predicted DNA-binding transcriptional regulator AlpA
MSNLLREKEVAEILKVSLATLRRRRCEGRPPTVTRIGTSVRYAESDIQAFIEDCRAKSGGDKKEAA